MEQGSAEWHAARLGKVTASRIADLMARTKTGYGASRANYMAELLVERLTEEPVNGYINAAMQWGIDTEPQACDAYAFDAGVALETVGFVEHPEIPMAGASPDRLVGDDGLLEVKCPNTATHLETLLGAPVPQKYMLQMQWQMACTGRQWCDFASYDPRVPLRMQLHVERVERNDEEVKRITEEVRTFLIALDAKLASLEAQYPE